MPDQFEQSLLYDLDPALKRRIDAARNIGDLAKTEGMTPLLQTAVMSKLLEGQVAEYEAAIPNNTRSQTALGRMGIGAAQDIAQNQPMQPNDLRTLAMQKADLAYQQTVRDAKATRGALLSAVQQGSGALELNDQQRQAIETGQPWTYTPEQARQDMLAKKAGLSSIQNLPDVVLAPGFEDLKNEAVKIAQAKNPQAGVPEVQNAFLDQVLPKYGLDPVDYKNYRDALTQQRTGSPPETKSWLGKIGNVITTGGRVAEAAQAGFMRPIEAANLPKQDSQDIPWYEAGPLRRLGADVLGGLGKAYSFAGQKISDLKSTGQEPEKELLTGQPQPNSSAQDTLLPHLVGRALQGVGGVLQAAGADQVYNTPSGIHGAFELATHPSVLKDAVVGALKSGALAGMKPISGGSEDPESMYAFLGQVREHLKQRAADDVRAKNPNATVEDAKARFRELLQKDAAGAFIDNPRLGQLVGESLLDPINYLPVDRATAAAGALLKKIPGVEKFAEGARSFFTRTSPGEIATEKLNIPAEGIPVQNPAFDTGAAPISGGQMASSMRASADVGQVVRDEWARRGKTVMAESGMNAIEGKWTAMPREVQQLGARLMSEPEAGPQALLDLKSAKTGGDEASIAAAKALVQQDASLQRDRDLRAFAQLPPDQQDTIRAMQKANAVVGAAHQQLREKYTPELMQRFGAVTNEDDEIIQGVLKPGSTKQNPNYWPHRIQAPEWSGSGLEETYIGAQGGKPKTVDPFASSQFERFLPVQAFEPNPAAQWRAEFADASRKYGTAAEMQGVLRTAHRGGLIQPIPKYAGPEATNAFAAALKAKTGVEFVPVDRLAVGEAEGMDVNDIISKLGGKPYEIEKHQFRYLVPKQGLGEYIPEMLAMAHKGPQGPMAEAMKAMDAINEHLLRPFATIARAAITRGGGMPYISQYAIGAASLPLVSAGFKVLEPRTQAFGVLGALYAASQGDMHAANMAKVLSDGSKITIKDAVKYLQNHGKIDLDAAKMGLSTGPVNWTGLSQEIKSPLRMAAKGAQFVGSRLGPVPLTWPLDLVGIHPFGTTDAIARSLNNYQTITTFMSQLKGAGPRELENALDLTGKLAGNYNRMGPAAHFLGQMGMFYGWYSYIYPLFVKQLIQHPEMLTPWIRGQDYLNREWGNKVARSPDALQVWQRDQMIVAPPKLQKLVHGEPGHRIAYLQIDSPWSMMGAFIPAMEAAWKGQGIKDSMSQYLAYGPRLAAELMTRKDAESGDTLPPVNWDIDQLVGDSDWGRLMGKNRALSFAESIMAPLSKPVQQIMDIRDLYWKGAQTHFAGLDLDLRLRASRDLGLTGDLLNKLVGKEVTFEHTGMNKLWAESETKNVAMKRETALKGAKQIESKLAKPAIEENIQP